MYVVNSETARDAAGILDFMPQPIRRYMTGLDLSQACEIHLRIGKPVCVHFRDGCFYINKRGNLTQIPASVIKTTKGNIEEALEIASGSSVYSVSDEIKNGFITVSGGHRIGIAGTAVIKEDKVSFIKNVSGLNYRLAGEVTGAADAVMPMIEKNGRIKNTLIISPPGAGKTTMLRDIARQLAYKAYRVSIVDERREIAAMHEGRSSFDLGFSTDVLEGADKACGMLMMLRSMSPDVIITDEIGKKEDVEAIERIVNSGAAVIASIHGSDSAMIKRRKDLADMLCYFDLIITLSRRRGFGTVEEALETW